MWVSYAYHENIYLNISFKNMQAVSTPHIWVDFPRECLLGQQLSAQCPILTVPVWLISLYRTGGMKNISFTPGHPLTDLWQRLSH